MMLLSFTFLGDGVHECLQYTQLIFQNENRVEDGSNSWPKKWESIVQRKWRKLVCHLCDDKVVIEDKRR